MIGYVYDDGYDDLRDEPDDHVCGASCWCDGDDQRPRCELDHDGGVCLAVLLPSGRCPRHGDGSVDGEETSRAD